MTKEEIIEMAIKSDFEIHPDNLITWDGIECTSELIAFAKLVAQHERKACANICEEEQGYKTAFCALKIRARGNHDSD